MNVQAYPVWIRAGLGLAVSLALAGLVVVTLAFGRGEFERGYELEAVFPSSSQGLFTDGGSSVKLRGVNIGQVQGIELQDDGSARLTLFIRHGVKVPDTAMAAIEPLSIFGPKFVRIEPGDHETSGPYLADGGRIERTRTEEELTDILAAATELFEHVDPMDLVVTIDAIAEGTAGLGPQIGRTIDATGALAGIAARHEADIRRFLSDAAALTETFAAHGDDVVAIGDDLDALVEATLDEPDRLERLLDSTVGISRSLSDLLADNGPELDVTIRSVGSFIHEVSVEADEIPEFLDLLGTFFGRLSDVIRMDGPAGTRMAALRGFISLDLCLAYGVCLTPSGAAATSTAPPSAAAVDARAMRALADAHPPTGPLADLATLLTGVAP